MSAIASAAGIGRATLYRHFAGREELVRELSLEAIRSCDEAMAPVFANWTDSRVALLGILEALIGVGDRFHFLAVEGGQLDDAELSEQIERQERELAEFVSYAKDEGLFTAELPTAWIVAVIDALVWAGWQTVAEGSIATRDVAGLAFRTITRGLSTSDDAVESGGPRSSR